MSVELDASYAVAPAANASKPAIFLQDACLQHRYIRSRDTSNIVERPERLRAVTIGLSAAISRLEEVATTSATKSEEPDDLAAQLGRLNIDSASVAISASSSAELPVSIVRSTASVDILCHPAVKYVHGDIEGDVYLENLVRWMKEARQKIEKGESEIPSHLFQGDLYLCPESLAAVQGAVGTICQAVDAIAGASETTSDGIKRAFVAIRPPGHHCGGDTPSGFCFVNNVAIGAAHAHLQHGINRVVIFDIDLHHGNGTQSIVWQINEETYRQTLETEGGAPSASKPGPQVYYGSIHDILSYPCEDGKAALVQAASVSIHGAHGQHIENVHLETYTSPENWEQLYVERYSSILRKAEAFLDSTGGPGDDVLVFISCGMDASEHEMPSMSRHGRRVPTSFYHRFTRDACALAERYACGRLISVLEGGYSDRALMSGAMAHLVGLAGCGDGKEEWWSAENLDMLENVIKKKRRGGRVSASASVAQENQNHPWLQRALAVFASLDPGVGSTAPTRAPVAPTSMTLRERKKPGESASAASSLRGGGAKGKAGNLPVKQEESGGSERSSSSSLSSSEDEGDDSPPRPLSAKNKLPRVILRLGPAPTASRA